MMKTTRIYNTVEAVDEIVQLQEAILIPCSPNGCAASWVYGYQEILAYQECYT